jgi:mannose-6-phosphate isomerase-like protein (cupin superfamily)
VIINEGELAASALQVVEKLWGKEFILVNTNLYCLKFLKVNPGYQCSIHAHKKKDETFVGVSGMLILDFHNPANKQRSGGVSLCAGDRYNVAPKTFHSFRSVSETWVMEVSTHHDDADVIRIQESRRLTT